MKILLINGCINGGGTEVQTKREYDFLRKKGHCVFLMTFDNSIKEHSSESVCNIHVPMNFFQRIYYRCRVNEKIRRKISAFLFKIQPDYIHVNNLHNGAHSILEACKGYRIIKTIRDPGLICPKATCLNSKGQICDGYSYGKCFFCVGLQINYQIVLWQFYNIRKKYLESVKHFICPSSFLAKKCCENGIPTQCVNNPFDFSVVKKKHPSYEKTFLYYGIVSEEKGVAQLLDAFSIVRQKHPEVKLVVAGTLSNICKERLDVNGVEYVGFLSQNDIMELYLKVFCVVVPSLWLENYPNTVLEAMACRTLVIGSNRGGIPEMIRDRKLVFDPLDIKDFVSKIEYVYNMPQADYVSIIERNYQFIKANNSIESYYRSLLTYFK